MLIGKSCLKASAEDSRLQNLRFVHCIHGCGFAVFALTSSAAFVMSSLSCRPRQTIGMTTTSKASGRTNVGGRRAETRVHVCKDLQWCTV